MHNTPLVSVIMPVYNSEKHLKEAIDSILNQTYKNIELIVIDDGSVDNSIKIIKNIKSDKIVFLKNERNIGVSATRNKGFSIAKGKYIALMDSDDISPLYRIEKQVEFLENNIEYGLVGGHYESFKKYLFFTRRKLRKHSLSEKHIEVNLNFLGAIVGGSTMIRSEVLFKNNLEFDTSLRIAEDFDLWRRIGQFSKVTNIDELLIHYRKHRNNSIKNREKNDLHMTRAIIKSFDDLDIDIKNLFNDQYKLKNMNSFLEMNSYLEDMINQNLISKKYDQKFLEKASSDLLFWFFKRHIDILGYELYKEFKKTMFFQNVKFRLRDKIKLFKVRII